MKIKLKAPRSIDGVLYKAGTHVVPDSLAKSWYFIAQVKSGTAEVLEGPAHYEAPAELPKGELKGGMKIVAGAPVERKHSPPGPPPMENKFQRTERIKKEAAAKRAATMAKKKADAEAQKAKEG